MPFLARHWLFALLIGGGLIFAPQQASALSLCGLLCSCTISTSSINIGNYNPISNQAITATGSMTVSCSLLAAIGAVLVPYTISLSKGTSGSYTTRQMIGPTSTMLNYNLYSDLGLSTVWGDGTGVSQLLSASLQVSVLNLLVPQIQNIYAQIPGNQNVPVGTYSDTITATLSF